MGLIQHAENELKLAGMYDADSGYGGMIPEAVMALVKAHAEQGHSGGSHEITIGIFNKVINFEALTPITSDPGTWVEVSKGLWQSCRQSNLFSVDGGQTWYCLDDPEKKNWPTPKVTPAPSEE